MVAVENAAGQQQVDDFGNQEEEMNEDRGLNGEVKGE